MKDESLQDIASAIEDYFDLLEREFVWTEEGHIKVHLSKGTGITSREIYEREFPIVFPNSESIPELNSIGYGEFTDLIENIGKEASDSLIVPSKLAEQVRRFFDVVSNSCDARYESTDDYASYDFCFSDSSSVLLCMIYVQYD
ncbi:hypothetical protein [Haliea salexigens]|uniref:hypothetical protein n=1 Tax=Haliea salexigens TaxID=287487 RepID=UPI0011820905|nr:hypothetical protein [Haliea salexigens]|tara:strand:- start:1545 stop:1973 length:429 start_codon:yes stop_codon:yes gene_type:complete